MFFQRRVENQNYFPVIFPTVFTLTTPVILTDSSNYMTFSFFQPKNECLMKVS